MSSVKDTQSRIQTAAYLALVTLFGLPLVSPLVQWASTPCTHDGHLHYHRIAALAHSWSNGLFFSRWMPDLAFGYGYPFLNFREAVPLYLTLWMHQLGFSLPASLNLFYIISIIAAGWFMFLWVRDLFGPISGVVSAAAYMAAPYLLIDALVRGNQPESIALALFPLLCWTGRRFMIGQNAIPFLVSVLAYVVLALSHNISLLLFTPFLFLYLAFVGWLARKPARRIIALLAMLFGLGLAISAFYVGPALLEMDQITISQSVSARNNDFRFNFASLSEMLARVNPADPLLLNPPLLIRLGWVTAALTILGAISGFLSKSREKKAHAIFMVLAAVTYLFMSTSLSKFIWEALPLIEFVQFPWRLTGRAVLPLAFLVGIPFSVLPELLKNKRLAGWITPLLAAVAVILLIVESTPYLYPHQCPAETFPDINTIQAYERNSGLVGVDPLGSYFPKTVLSRPKGSPLEEAYQAGITPIRFDFSQLPDNAILEDGQSDSLNFSTYVDTPTAFQARYLAFDFPGWTAKVDGNPVPITPSDPEGLITFPVPAGAHLIEVGWGNTALRAVLTALSLAALAALFIAALMIYMRGSRKVEEGSKSSIDPELAEEPEIPAAESNHWLTAFLILLGASLLLIIIRFLIFDSESTPLFQASRPPVELSSGLAAEGLRLAGADLDDSTVEAGDSLEIDLAWITETTPNKELQSNLAVRGADGHLWSVKETYRPRTFQEPSPTTFWLPAQWAWDSRQVEIFEGTPPGTYELVLTIFDRSTLQPIQLTGPGIEPSTPETILGQIEVTGSASLSEQTPQYEVEAAVQGLDLLGYNIDRDESIPGDSFLLTLFWSSDSAGNYSDGELVVSLVDSQSVAVDKWPIPPVSQEYPPAQWEEDLTLRGQHTLKFRAAIASGAYTLMLEDLPLGPITIEAPERHFTPPDFEDESGIIFEDLAKLVGYSLDYGDEHAVRVMTADLIWQALGEIPERYRVFVHLIDENDHILVQSDGEPAGWSRPTSGWLEGEYIMDTHTLQLPESLPLSDLALRIGLYNPVDGDRLSAGDKDFVIIPADQN